MDDILKSLAFEEATRSIIMVAGVGGAGGNALDHMIDLGINDVTFMACNTDAQVLAESKASIKIQLGSGLGAGNKPEKGNQAAKESLDDVINVLRSEGIRMLFITAGMGGGTGTGASPVIAKAAQELGILTVAIVTTPYRADGALRNEQAMKGIEELRRYTDSLMVISNDDIVRMYGELPFNEGFWKADDIVANAVKGIAEIITGRGIVNVDFADVDTVMRGSGKAFVGSGRGKGADRAREAIDSSLNSLLSFRDITGARDILLNIGYGKRVLTQNEAGSILGDIQRLAGWSANIIWGTSERPELGDELEIMVVATGFPGGTTEEPAAYPPATEKPKREAPGEPEAPDGAVNEPEGELNEAEAAASEPRWKWLLDRIFPDSYGDEKFESE